MGVISKAFELADKLMGGELENRLRAWRAEDPPVSYDRIARLLENETGVHHSRETVRRWCQQIEKEDVT